MARYCSHYEMGRVRNPVQVLRMIGRLPTPTPSSMGFFYSPQVERSVREMLAERPFDLIFVHCSSVAQYVEGVRGIPKILDFGDMDSQKWLDYARYKPFPLSLGYRLEGLKLQREEKRLASCFDLCTATTRAEWETLESYGTERSDRTGFRTVSTANISHRRTRPTTPIRSRSSAAWITTRTRSACSTSVRVRCRF